MAKLSERIKFYRESAGLKQIELAPILSVNVNTLGAYERAERLPEIDFLINFCEETDADFGELLDLRIQDSPATQGDIDKVSKYLIKGAQRHLRIADKLAEQIPNYNLDDQKAKMAAMMQDSADYQHTLYIEHYPDVRAAAGSGQVTPTDQVMVNVAINADELRALNHKNIKLITVYGDSMKPTLSHGDQVFVDVSCTNFIDDAIYAVQQGDLTRIKRIKLRFDGSIEVRSDNEKNGFSTETYNKLEAADFHVIGRVIPYKFGKFEI